jgi:glutathione S-transferase
MVFGDQPCAYSQTLLSPLHLIAC